MRLEFHEALRNPQVAAATRLVVYDANGTPLVAIVEHAQATPGDPRRGYIIETIENPAQLNLLLRNMGVAKTVLVQDVATKPLSEVIWTP